MANENVVEVAQVEVLATKTGDARVEQAAIDVACTSPYDVTQLVIPQVAVDVLLSAPDPITAPMVQQIEIEVLASVHMAVSPSFIDDFGNDFGLIGFDAAGGFTGEGIPKFTVANIERNPYAAHLPETPEEKADYDAEQQKILREQHNKTQAGDTTFDYGLLLKPYTAKEFTLGSLGRFYHPDYGMILARFCQLDQFVDSTFQGQPVGRLKSAKSKTVDWVVTNDFSKSGADLAVGVVFFAVQPTDKAYGWVVVNGANPAAVSSVGAPNPNQNQAFSWTASNRLEADAEGCTIARTWGWTPGGSLMPGTLFIEVERWSLGSLRAIVQATTQETIDALAALTQRVTANEEKTSANAASIKAADEIVATLKRQLEREIQVRQRQIDALRSSINDNGDFSTQLTELRVGLETKITDGDHANDVKIRAAERAIESMQRVLARLDPAAISEELNNLSNAVGFLSSQIRGLYVPTTTGLTLVSAVVGTNDDGTNRLGFIQIGYKLANLTDVDTVTTPPTDGQVLKWNAASSKWLPGVGGGGLPAGGAEGNLIRQKADGTGEWYDPIQDGFESASTIPYGAHRYWRIFVTANRENSGTAKLVEVEMRATPAGSDITTGGTPIGTGSGVNNAFDGGTGSAWSSGGIPSACWIGYDFGTPVNILQVRMQLGDSLVTESWLRVDAGNIQYSDDAATWTTAWTFNNSSDTNDYLTTSPVLSAPGQTGYVVPEGGDSGQVLAKASATDGDLEWIDPPEGGGSSASGSGAVRTFAAATLDCTGSIPTIKRGYNCASLTRLSTGTYRITFATPLTPEQVARAGFNAGGKWPVAGSDQDSLYVSLARNGSLDTTGATIITRGANGTIFDVSPAATFVSFEIYDTTVPARDGGASGAADFGPHKYWRLWIPYGAGQEYAYAISEIQMRAAKNGPDQCVGGTPTASSGVNVANAFNDNPADWWELTFGTEFSNRFAWVKYEFLTPVRVNEVYVRARSDAPKQLPQHMFVQYSDDNIKFETAWDFGVNAVIAPNGSEIISSPVQVGGGLPTPYWMAGVPATPKAADFAVVKSDAAIPTSIFEEDTGIVLEIRAGPSPGADRTVGLEKTVATGVFDFQALLVTQNLQRAYQNIGLYCRNQTNNRFMTFGLGDNQQWGYNVLRWNSPGSYSSAVINNQRRMPDTPIWMRLKCDGTSLQWALSKNGKYWTVIHGIGMSDWVGTDARRVGIHYVASQADGPQNVDEYLHVMAWRLT